MVAYRYCQGDSCDAPLNAPTIGECLAGAQRCAACGEERGTEAHEAIYAAEQLGDRLAVLERHFADAGAIYGMDSR